MRRTEVNGSVEHIIFRNNDNGYTVLVIEAGGERITASGTFPSVSEGASVRVLGEWRETKYGMQIVAEQVELTQPSDVEGILRYLSSGLIKGVGQATAARIVGMFGENTLEVIEHQPDKLKMVKGISARKAVEIANSFTQIKSMQRAVMFLQGLGLTTNMALKIYEVYGEKAEELVVKNPYRLIEDVDGIGFATADKIAYSLGIASDSDFRIRACLVYTLKDNTSSGSTCLPESLLYERTCRQLGGPAEEQRMAEIVKELIVDGHVSRREMPGEQPLVALSALYHTERSIAARLKAIREGYSELHLNIENELTSYEKVSGIVLHAMQREAVLSAVNSGVAVITGGPGTGKTTIVNCILSILEGRGLQVELVAPTGRAAKRLTETTGGEAKTIHRLLDLDFKDGKGYFTYNDNTKLDADAVIVDEVSMVDAYVMNSLLKAIRDGARLILVGDKDQLPSVGAGNILADIISSNLFPVTCLTEIYRQGESSLIITNAHRINRGEMPVLNATDADFFFQARSTPLEAADTVLDMVTRRIPGFRNVEPTRIQVLCPMKKGICGSVAINERLQAQLNPHAPGKAEVTREGTVFRRGDKVMQTANNYQLEWTRGMGEQGVGVFNGDIGFVTEVRSSIGELTVDFEDGREARYSAVDAEDLALAYAISIHKSQGSEFDIVVIPITKGHRALFTRNLLYTAVTRARKMAVLVGSREAVRLMVENDYTEKRYSLLEDFLVRG